MAPIWPVAEGIAKVSRVADSESHPFPIRAEALRHAPNRLRNDGDGDDLEAVQPCNMRYVPEAADAISEGDEGERRRNCEAEPRRKSARQTGTHHAENDTDLTACRAGKELAERDNIGVGSFVEPLAALDEFGAEIARCAIGPPKLVTPSRRKTQSTSRNDPWAACVSPRRPCSREPHVFGGSGAVNSEMSPMPSACSMRPICATASSNPSLPNC